MLEQLKEFNPDLGFDEASAHVFSDEGRYGVALGFGYVLGETMNRLFGGHWEYGRNSRMGRGAWTTGGKGQSNRQGAQAPI